VLVTDASAPAAIEQLIEFINDRHASTWVLVERLAGGSQQGAYEIADVAGIRAVLKWHRGHLPARKLDQIARVIESARARGWPTSRWLACGSLSHDGAYIVEELIVGERPSQLAGIDDDLLEAIRLQAGAKPDTDQDWSAYVYRCVFEGEGDLANRMRARRETAELQERLEAMTAAARSVVLPTDDLVHGDFVLNNIVVRDGRPYLIDAAHAGKGTRAYDLATLLFETSVGTDYVPPGREVQRQLERLAVECVGRDGFLVCLACRVMHLLVFGGVNWSDEVPATVRRCHGFLDGLESIGSH
jgi:hypothetical protein